MNQDQVSELLIKQQEIGKAITSLHERFGKENRSRRNKLQRLLEWRGKFNDEWAKFLDNHDVLKEAFDQLKEENYFKENYYDFIKAYYQDGLTRIVLQETIEKRKNGLPTIQEEPVHEPADTNQNQEIDNEDQNEDNQDEIGFVTTMGDHLQRQSTPKPEFFNDMENVNRFWTLEKILARKIDEIENFVMQGLKVRAKIILGHIEEIWNRFHSQMETVCSTSGEFEREYYDAYQQIANRYYQILEEIGEPTNKNTIQNTAYAAENTQVRLEPLKIPKFKGTYETWPTFSGLFETLIIANKSLTDVQRMQYLKSVVTDEADRAIASLTITNENFEKAWKILTERFDNKQVIIDNQISRVFELEKVQANSAQQLRKLHDKSKEYYALLKNVPGERYLIHVLKSKLDNFSRNLYQQQIEDNAGNEDIDSFFAFLHKRCRVLEATESKQNDSRNEKKSHESKNKQLVCGCCGKNHAIYFCEKFKSMKVNERSEVVKSKALCVLCLRPNHKSSDCSYTKKMCPTCGKKHNGLLHFEKTIENKPTKRAYLAVTDEGCQDDETQVGAYTVGATNNKTSTLLATALIRIKTSYGWSEILRVLIDQGSMLTFITERAVKLLDLKQTKNSIDISGIAGSVQSSKSTVDVEITARYPTSFSVKTTAVVLSKLTTLLPITGFDKMLINDRKIYDLILADPNFNKCGKIDMILGADIYSSLIMEGMIKAKDNSFVAQETEVGWILSGPIQNSKLNQAVCMIATSGDIDKKLEKFWEIENISEHREFTEEEQMCVSHFEESIKRGPDGVYSVALPFKKDAPALGDSRKMALAQFFQLERKFEKDPNLKTLYTEYIDDMLKRGYLKKCESKGTHVARRIYYLPHHPVYKKSITTKIRPVFNASVKATNGVALNDILMTGPRLQEELFNILIRFRAHKIAFSADIEKMYLHINLDEEDQDCQRIIWRKNSNEPLQDYRLTTVTFGVNCSPFLAIAAMQYHAKNNSIQHPEACKIILEDSYVDDISSGCDNVETAIKLQKEITQVLGSAGFPLRKWISNSSDLMKEIPAHEKEGVSIEIRNNYHKFVTTLGVPWFFESDKIGFYGDLDKSVGKLTKRAVLSELLSIFDPLGLLSPITIYNKILMQKIWKQKIDWDDEVDSETREKWMQFREQVPLIEKIRVPRWLNWSPGVRTELIGFCDASESAIGACVYLKTYVQNDVQVILIASKTKVAPIKKVTLPRLELCAAELLTKLMKTIKCALKFETQATHYYSDSQIALAWIKSDPIRWKTFVANRVSRIQGVSRSEEWHYINTKANPADMASRGLLPVQLIDNKLWWEGPSVLLNDETYQHDGFETDIDEKQVKLAAFHTGVDTSIIEKFSSLNRAVRTIASCLKFTGELKKKKSLDSVLQKAEVENACKNFVLTTNDLECAKFSIISMYQQKHFHDDLCSLKEKHELTKKSKLHGLYPFMDNTGILRVGGRLQNSNFNFNKKHPIIIPAKGKLTELIIDEAHKKTLHGGNQLTLAEIRHEYWIIGAKRAVKKYINNCVICHRFRKADSNQLMGSLPMARTKMVSKAFTNTGVDLCGPLYLKVMKTRGVITQKGYIVIFVCMSTRAIHIEIVTDLTAEAFIASFKRFIGRRGNVAHLYSDNGTNFIGANTILNLESEQAMKEYNENIQRELANLKTKFHFNPSLSPWMGGIWERGVGSIKHHLKRTIKDRILTYEQLTTLLIQIEAILNSRPISPLNENPDDLDVLTPGHFLVGTALTAPVEPSLTQIRENRLTDWQLCVRLKQEFWQKWSNDYISQLQLRSKWKNSQPNLSVGDMVLVKEDNTAPMHWPLGRITKVFPGKDNLVRVVEVLMKGKLFKRPIVKLAPLPKNTQGLEEEIDLALKKEEQEMGRIGAQNSCHVAMITSDSSDLETVELSSMESFDDFSSLQSFENSQEYEIGHEISEKSQENSTIIHVSHDLCSETNPIESSKNGVVKNGKRKRNAESDELEPPLKKLKYHFDENIDGSEKIYNTRKNPRKNYKMAISLSFLGVFGLLIILFGYLFSPVSANYTVNQFPSHTMAYVQKCNNITEITGYWNLAVHNNLDDHYHNVDQLHEALHHMELMCYNQTIKSICTKVLSHFDQKLNEITAYERFIKNEMSIRDKRGVGLALLGVALGSAGTMVYNWISNKRELEHQAELLEKHTSIIDLTSQQLTEFAYTLNKTSLHNSEETWATVWLSSAFHQIAESQNKILEKITKNEISINTNEIPMDTLIKNIKLISTKLKPNVQLVGATTMEKAMYVYKLATLDRIIVVKSSIISILKIPIVRKDHFECHKIIPTPFKNSQKTNIITISGQYVLTNQNTSEYCILTEHEMQKCSRSFGFSLCEINKTLNTNMTNVCELNIALNMERKNCNIIEQDNSNEFLEKVHTNSWLFSVNDANATITCGDQKYTKQLNGIGILKFEQLCNVNINNVTLHSIEYENSDVFVEDEHWKIIELEAAEPAKVNLLSHLKDAIREIKNTQQSHHYLHIHHTTILYAFIAWIVFCFVLMIIRKRRNKAIHPVITIEK